MRSIRKDWDVVKGVQWNSSNPSGRGACQRSAKAVVVPMLTWHSHTELQPSPPSLRSPRPGVASGSLARQTHGRCQRRRNTAGRRNRRQCWYPTCCRPSLPGATATYSVDSTELNAAAGQGQRQNLPSDAARGESVPQRLRLLSPRAFPLFLHVLQLHL